MLGLALNLSTISHFVVLIICLFQINRVKDHLYPTIHILSPRRFSSFQHSDLCLQFSCKIPVNSEAK